MKYSIILNKEDEIEVIKNDISSKDMVNAILKTYIVNNNDGSKNPMDMIFNNAEIVHLDKDIILLRHTN